jgi:hypothetical protein
MSEEEQIEDLKSKFRREIDSNKHKQILDTLATYGNKGVSAILDLINVAADDEIESYGLELVKKIRGG